MKLFWKDKYLGLITEVSGDFPWMNGTFQPHEINEDIFDFFNFMIDEDKGFAEPPFSDDLLDESNWSILTDSEERKGISIPAVHLDDKTIDWRWR